MHWTPARLDGLDDAVGLGDGHRHRLAEDEVLAGARRGDGDLGDLRNRRRDVDDVHVLAREHLAIVGVSGHAEGRGEGGELGGVFSGDGGQPRVRILGERRAPARRPNTSVRAR